MTFSLKSGFVTAAVSLTLFQQSLAATPPEALSPPRPAPAVNPLISRIALGSCSNQNHPQPVLRTVLDWQPELFIYLGDNVYADSREISVIEAAYAKLAAKPEFQALRAQVPTIATWDDHDYGENDAGSEFPLKEASKDIFLRFFNEPAESPRRQHPGIYTSYRFGNPEDGKSLQVILLDTRTFRTPLAKNGGYSSWKNDYHPDPNPENTFLGEQQWAWLKERLLEPADLRIIGSSIQFGHEHNGWESWTNFPSEVRKMVNLIQETRANGVVFISGDVHWGELSVLQAPNCYPLHDLTSSGINQEWSTLEPNGNRHGEACMDHNFGLIQIDWEATNPSVTLAIRDITGRARTRKSVRLEELTLAPPSEE